MRIVHLSGSPQSGLLYRISSAVQRHTDHESRMIVSAPGYGAKTFPYDLLWGRDKNECDLVLRSFDIYVLYGYYDPRSKPWVIEQYLRPHCRVTAHYGIEPPQMNRTLIHEGIPTSVSCQYHRRFLPESVAMPNVMPIREPLFLPNPSRQWPPHVPLRIVYSPSNKMTPDQGLKKPWGRKGYHQTVRILEALKKEFPGKVETQVLYQRPYEDCLQARSMGHICIDECATGSYHSVFLEGMSQGLLSVAHLDEQTLQAVAEVAGPEAIQDPPWLNVPLQDLHEALQGLVQRPEEVQERAQGCRAWMERFWDDAVFAQRYVEFWKTLPPYLSTRPAAGR